MSYNSIKLYDYYSIKSCYPGWWSGSSDKAPAKQGSVKPQCPPLHQKKAKFKNMEKVWRFSLLSSWRNSGASVSEELKTLR
jgi:hypothetical protein